MSNLSSDNQWWHYIIISSNPRVIHSHSNKALFLFLPQLSEDWQIDYESYDWRKLDPDSEECKTMVKEYFAWEGDFKHVGKAFNQGKIFK